MSTARSSASFSVSSEKSIPRNVATDTPLALQEEIENPLAGQTLPRQLLLPFLDQPVEGRRRIRVPVEDAGVQLAPVMLREVHGPDAIGRIVAQALEGLHLRLLRLDLLVVLAV